MKKGLLFSCLLALALLSCNSKNDTEGKKEPVSDLASVVMFKEKEVSFVDHAVQNISVKLNLDNRVVKSDANNTEYQINLVDANGVKVTNLHVNPEKLVLSKSASIKDFQISSDNAPLDGSLYISLERDGKQVMQFDSAKYYVTKSYNDIEINKDNINSKYKAGAWLNENGMFIFDTSTGLTGPASFITDNGDIYFDLVSDYKKVEKDVQEKFISSVLSNETIKNTIFKTAGVCPEGWVEEYDQQQVFASSADGKIKTVGIVCQDTANPKQELLYSYFLDNGKLGKLDIDDTPVAGGPIYYKGLSNNGKYLMYDNLGINSEIRGEDTMFDILAKKSIIMHNPDGSRFLSEGKILSFSDNGNVLAYRWEDKKDHDKGFMFMLCSAITGTCKDIVHSNGDYDASTMSDDGKFIYLITEVNKVKKLLVLDEQAKVIKENPFDLSQFKANYGYFYLTAHNSGVLELEYFEKVDENNDRRVIKFYSYSANKLVSLVDVVKALKLTRIPEKDTFLRVSLNISPNEMYALVLFSETDDPGYNGVPLVAMNRVFLKNGIDSVISGIQVSKS